ncbi:MAG: xylulokinase [Anaerolineales bacterium]|nr:xylulokinase [Anaerolineales bacterium]MDW8446783.1 xylulokinase [Anaerolineales bacterium]
MYFCGIDVSTTATKALLVNEEGEVIATATKEYSFETPKPLWSEQHPDLWWEAAQVVLRLVFQQSGINSSEIGAIGLTGQMHGLVLLDRQGNVLRPAILWNDQRTQKQCEEIHERLGRERFIQITGNPALTGFTAPKILWVKENEPEIFARVAHILLPKDYVRYRLTGQFAMDKADGAGTVLMDLGRRAWSEEILEALEIPIDWMPTLFEGTEITGEITKEASQVTGLTAGTPVVGGGGDQAAQAVGVGSVTEGIVALTLGTSGVVFASTDHPFIEPEGRLHAFCHAAPGKWHLMGVMLSAAGSLRWFHDSFAPSLSYEELVEPAAQIPIGCEGLLFLPYLTGERTPYPDPFARGAFVGLTVRHSLAHCVRAVLEGVAFGLRDSFELIRSVGMTPLKQVRLSGGGAKSLLWRQILADVLNIELVTVNTTEGAAFGAALLAAVGARKFPDITTACEQIVRITGCISPNQAAVEQYEAIYPLYRELYPTLKPRYFQPHFAKEPLQ